MDTNTIQNENKLIDLVKLIQLTRAILLLRLSDFLKYSTIDFCMFFVYGNMFPESHGFVTLPVTTSMNDACFNLSQSN